MATAAGFHSALAGARSVPGTHDVEPAIDSELRYYGAFYCAYGVSLLNAARRPVSDPDAVQALAATLFGAGLARATGWAAHGPPHPIQRALLAVELTAPAVLAGWQRRLAG